MYEVHYGLGITGLLVIALLIGLPLLVGFAFGRKAAVIFAIATVFVGGGLFMLVASYQQAREQTVRTAHAEVMRLRGEAFRNGNTGAVPDVVVERPLTQPQDPALQAFAALLSEQRVFSDRPRPSWADQPPGLDHGVYRWPVKSGLYSTQEECRQALAAAVAGAVAQYAAAGVVK
jgi:hypothetical protein